MATRRPATSDLLTAAVQAEADALGQIAGSLAGLLRYLLDQLDDYYDSTSVDTFVQQAGAADQRARAQAAAVADTYLRYAFDLLEIESDGRPEPIPDLPRGIPLTDQWVRPVKEFRRARLAGLEEFEAAERAIARAERMAEMDVATAARDSRGARLAVAPDVIGWRRVIHPELSAGGTCGLCIAAADRVYGKGDLLPLHNRCKCTVAPITKTNDPGSPLNEQSLRDLYRTAGSTGRQDLARVRMRIEQHGELGPVLVDARHDFRGPADVASDSDRLREIAAAELAQLRQSLAQLEARQSAGEDVAGPIAWQRDRIAALEELSGAA